ncbi:MAG: 4-hydroxythreonine-4-phosphate dehydrogenase [Bacteroidota bacterium]|nr:MAG: 4-hydroxythreonine-4-phosphate dehydrogenase [Bacteroidota bacterium]
MSALPIVAISVGDPNGIGVEVLLRAFQDNTLFEHCIPVVYADFPFMQAQQAYFGTQVPLQLLSGRPNKGVMNIKSVWEKSPEIDFGKQSTAAGTAAFKSLQAAALAVQQKKADALVTAPIHKAAIKSNAFPFAGHTHYLASLWGGKALMILAHQKLRVALLTDHIPLAKVASRITPDLIQEKTLQLAHTLKNDFGYSLPKIALLGLNPHAGDQGVIGSEDDRILKPTIEKLQKEEIDISGPFAADGFFGQKSYQNVDAVLSCYHDQGLVGFKTLAFGKGVNITAGLPFVRTSPDHGTAFAIAGKGIANYDSFAAAVQMACDIWNARQKNN